MEKATQHELDLLVVCSVCSAAQGVECVGLKPGIVHIGRRVLALLKARGATVEDLERAIEAGTTLPKG
jgi:hypothetical protein